MEITNESGLTWGPAIKPMIWRQAEGISLRTLGPKEFRTGSFEAVGGRTERQDFKVSSRRLSLVLQDIEKNGGLLPTWMTETGVTPEQLRFVVADIEADARQGHRRHGYLRFLLDGMGGEGGGYWAGEIGGMYFLFKYHEAIAAGQTDQIVAFRQAEEAANRMLVAKREREGKNFGKASYLADLSLSDGHHLIWLGDVRGQVFENGKPRRDLRTVPHKPLFEAIPEAVDWPQDRINAHPLGHLVSAGLGLDYRIPKNFRDRHLALGYLAPNQTLLLWTDGVTLPTEELGRFLRDFPDPQKAVEAIAAECLRRGTRDNLALRAITDRGEAGTASAKRTNDGATIINGQRQKPGRGMMPAGPKAAIPPSPAPARPPLPERPAPQRPAEKPRMARPESETPYPGWNMTVRQMEKEGLFAIDENSVEAYISRRRVLVQFPKQDKPIVVPPDFLWYCFRRWREQYSKNPMDTRVPIPTPHGTTYVNGFQLQQIIG